MKIKCFVRSSNSQKMNISLESKKFALELVHCVFRRYSLRYTCRDYHKVKHSAIKQRFTSNIRQATKSIVASFRNFSHQTFMASGQTDEERFQHLSNSLFTTLFQDGFNEKSFLSYCIHIAKLASRIYSHGFEKAPIMAVDAIVDTMDYFHTNMDLNEESWVELEQISAMLCK